MKLQKFEIKVADLLNNPGSKDELSFNEVLTEQLPNLNKDGISFDLLLQSLDKNSILVDMENVKCINQEICDVCQNPFDMKFSNDLHRAKFILPSKDSSEDLNQSYDQEELFPIDVKKNSINIEDMLVQAIVLLEPIVKRCKSCESKYNDIDAIDDEDMYAGSQQHSNIVFK